MKEKEARQIIANEFGDLRKEDRSRYDTLVSLLIKYGADESRPVEKLVMPKIADNWLNDKCINNACWFHNIITKNNCANGKINDDITGCSPRIEHKQLLNQIIGKKKADKISYDSNFSV